MISLIRGYKIRNVNRKTKYFPNFVQSASSLHKHNEPTCNLKEEIENGAFANVLYKQGKLDGYYLIKKERVQRQNYLPKVDVPKEVNCYRMIDSVLPKKMEEDTRQAIEEEIVNSLKEDIAFGKVDGIIWNQNFYTINRLEPFKATIWAIIIGLLLAILLWVFLKNLAISIIVGVLWALALGSISFSNELNHQVITLKENADS